MFNANLAHRPAPKDAVKRDPKPQKHDRPTPIDRISALSSLTKDRHWQSQEQNLKALIRYYEEGSRCPVGDEEIWAIDGELSWGVRRSSKDFDRTLFFDPGVMILCERHPSSKIIFEECGTWHKEWFNSDSHPVLVARCQHFQYDKKLRDSLRNLHEKIEQMEMRRLRLEHLLARCQDDSFHLDKGMLQLASSGDSQRRRPHPQLLTAPTRGVGVKQSVIRTWTLE